MKTKYKKIVVAIQTAFITSLVCSALPSYASDTELYKAPQTSETTIMFMLDVSGSMNPNSNNYRENRIQSLKNGMIKLLQGDANTDALPDKLVVGLSEFAGSNGRIKLEARALGDKTYIPNAQVFREIQPKIGNAEQSYIKITVAGQYRDKSSGRWSTLSPTQYSYSDGNISTSNLQDNGAKQFEECIEWNSDNTCKDNGWISTTKRANDFGTVTSNTTNTNYAYSWASTNDGSGVPIPNSSTYPATTSECIEQYWWGCNTTRYYQNLVYTQYNGKKSGSVSLVEYKVYTGTAEDTHRKRMLRAVNLLNADDSTPTGYAFAEVAAYMMGQSTKGLTGSGFSNSNGLTAIQNGNSYIAPSSVTKAKQCNTQGIYFLTDGQPQYYYNKNKSTLQTFMENTLGTKKGSFSCSNASTLGLLNNYSTNGTMSRPNGWDCIGAYTKALLDPNLNPAGVKIKTAVVGFGSDFNSGTGSDVQDAQKWGTLGEGGWYSGSNDADVVASVNAFLKKLQKYIPPVTTGSITIPVDNLDTQNIQPWGYFPQFDPAPDAQVTTWIGNLKKYQVVDNIIKDRDSKIVFDAAKGISVDDPNDYWADTAIKKTISKIVQENNVDVEKEFEVRVGGALSQFKLGNVNNIERTIYTDRKVGNDGTASSIGNDKALLQVSSADLKANNPTNNFSLDTKRGYLAALFGYNVTSAMASNLTTSNSDAANTSFVNFLTQSNATLRQMGAVMHSRPILITQKGTTQFDAKTGDLSYKDRDDLIVFGTTQGLLHVIRAGDSATDSNAGKEVFTFVPNEMIEKQSKGFLNQENQGRNLEYGVDGPWTAYTEYVTKSGTNASEPVVTVSGGKQWLYGGLRMGGRSYYALDLSEVTSTSGKPKIKFRISPDDAAAYSPISYMGQSWSKPTLAWINWQGSRKLVMIVGGGYDPIYENIGTPTSSSIDKGAGVYIFDAETGSVLWWASANAAANKVTETNVSNMKRSVVSQIKAIDRNSDGLVDHLYFGDLGGQLWRVDLDSSAQAGKTANLAKRVTRILNQSNASDVPRFYSTPTFTIHNNGGSLFAVLTIGSGNLSSPMSETNKNDALYAVYDKDVTRRNLSVLKDSELNSVDINSMTTGSKQLVKNTDGNTATSFSFGGWYYPLGSKKRVLNDNIAIDSDLYVSIFNANIDIDDVDCYGGVRGESKANQFCLPYGQCTVLSGNTIVVKNRPNEISLGKGNIGISFGGKDKNRGLVLNFPTTESLTNYTSKTKFISQRWYER